MIILDTATDSIADEIVPEERPWALAAGEGAVWIAAQSVPGQVYRVDPSTLEVSSAFIEVGEFPYAVTTGAGAVWVANQDSATVSRIDPGSNQVTATITLPKQDGVEPQPSDIAFG